MQNNVNDITSQLDTVRGGFSIKGKFKELAGKAADLGRDAKQAFDDAKRAGGDLISHYPTYPVYPTLPGGPFVK